MGDTHDHPPSTSSPSSPPHSLNRANVVTSISAARIRSKSQSRLPRPTIKECFGGVGSDQTPYIPPSQPIDVGSALRPEHHSEDGAVERDTIQMATTASPRHKKPAASTSGSVCSAGPSALHQPPSELITCSPRSTKVHLASAHNNKGVNLRCGGTGIVGASSKIGYSIAAAPIKPRTHESTAIARSRSLSTKSNRRIGTTDRALTDVPALPDMLQTHWMTPPAPKVYRSEQDGKLREVGGIHELVLPAVARRLETERLAALANDRTDVLITDWGMNDEPLKGNQKWDRTGKNKENEGVKVEALRAPTDSQGDHNRVEETRVHSSPIRQNLEVRERVLSIDGVVNDHRPAQLDLVKHIITGPTPTEVVESMSSKQKAGCCACVVS